MTLIEELNEYMDEETAMHLPLKNRWLFLESKDVIRHKMTPFNYKDVFITSKGLQPTVNHKGKQVTVYEKWMADIDFAITQNIKNNGVTTVGNMGIPDSKIIANAVNKVDSNQIYQIKKDVENNEETIRAEDVPF